ncbi:MAG: NYN domain-containing protein [Clostridiales bacterium]|nr:NYN domain-containing protein [Clostridiales bacterium]
MRVSVFLDGANFFYMQKDGLRQFIDPKKLYDYISTEIGQIEDAYYYIGQDAPPDAQQQSYLDALPNMGFAVVTKQIKSIYDQSSGQTKQKANLDIEIVLDMFNTIDNYDLAVLISGDGDFDRALQLLKARGKKFKVLSTGRFIARELRQTAGMHYIDLSTILDKVKKL